MRVYKVVNPNSPTPGQAPSNSGSLEEVEVQLPTVKNTRSSRSNSSGSGGVRNSLDSTSSGSSISFTNGSSAVTNVEVSTSSLPSHGSTVTCPKNLFDEVESLVLKSDSLLQFVESLSETMKCENFTLHDFRFIKKQFSNYDPSEWEVIGSSDHHKCYMSKRTYDMGESVGLSFFKFDVTFPYSAKQVMNTFFEQEYRYQYDGELSRIEQLAYYEKKISNSAIGSIQCMTSSSSPSNSPQISPQNNIPSSPTTDSPMTIVSSTSSALNNNHSNATSILLATSLTQEIYKLVWPFSNRDFIVSSSGIYDLSTNTYFMGKKSCLSEKAKKPEKNVVRAFSFGGWAYKEIDEKQLNILKCFIWT
ncbi:hypothetical protein FDP41_000888 [Naegleria fowleri]|uniref:START domain-containing protein n=1 Tax=Naegleria fowleri TaxID=5763 RepID=A0A6A5C2N0_NAEFO|nr:uncharacterized protein FDP41_000888 [Naegleria fowleri]KAF0980110.1 hypothetical protein FDP41_000888 [Naegleria fowleri]